MPNGSYRSCAGILRALAVTLFLAHPAVSFAEEKPDHLPDAVVLPSAAVSAIDNLAVRAAEKFAKAHTKTIAINHFSTIDNCSCQNLGNALSAQFAISLAKISPTIETLDRVTIRNTIREHNWLAIDYEDTDVYSSAAYLSGGQIIVDGTFTISGHQLELKTILWDFTQKKSLAEFKAKMPIGADTKSEDAAPYRDPDSGVYLGVAGGLRPPTCVRCRNPDYTDVAKRKRIQGNIYFLVTIGTDGLPRNIMITRQLGYGLDENADAAIRKWTFKPGQLLDGTPVPIRVKVEVSFHLY